MTVMVTVSVVAWKLNRHGQLVNKKTGGPFVLAMEANETDIEATSGTTVQFNSSQFTDSNLSGTGHFFAANGTAMARHASHKCNTPNCERTQMTKNGNALQNQQWTSHSGERHRIAPSGPVGRSRFDIITRVVGLINLGLCYGTDPDVFDPEHQPKLNSKSADVTVNTIAKIATYLDDDVDETDYISEVVTLCRKIGQGCYVEFDISSTRAEELPYKSTPNERRWTCLYTITCSPNPAGTLNTAKQTRWPGLCRMFPISFPDAHPDNVVAPMFPQSGGSRFDDPLCAEATEAFTPCDIP
jgi:hypothetical protein